MFQSKILVFSVSLSRTVIIDRISLGDVVDLADEQHAVGLLNVSLLKEDKDKIEKMNG